MFQFRSKRQERIRALELSVAELTRQCESQKWEIKKLLQEITDLINAGQRAAAAVNARDARQKAQIASLEANQLSDEDKQSLINAAAEVNNDAAVIEAENAAVDAPAEA